MAKSKPPGIRPGRPRRTAAARPSAGPDDALRAGFEHASIGIAFSDREVRFFEVNPRFAEILGYDPQELIGRSFRDVTHPDDLPASREQVRRMFDDRLPGFSLEKRYVRKDGSQVWGHVTSSTVRDAAGNVRFVVVTLEDITERRRVEQEQLRLREQLQQAMKMEAVGRLAGGVAHDFNNLLTAIIGNIDLALLDLGPEHPLRATLEEVNAAADRAAELTRQLLAFGRRQVTAPRTLDLNAVVDKLRRMLTRVLGEDIDLQTVLTRPLGAVHADPGQVEQCLVNLAINARDAMPAGGSLRLSTAERTLDEATCRELPELRPGPHVVLSVADDGVGMTPDVLAHAFEPFFTTKPAGRGTGLGLATVFGVMQQHRGGVTVTSSAGQGTTVSLFFPRAAAEETPAPGPRPDLPLPTGTETVLLVEDDTHVRELARHMLCRLGYDVLVAEDGPAALRLAASHTGPLQLLVTDVVMPGMSGRELADRLRETRPQVRVLFISGYSEEVISRRGVLEPGVNLLPKPFTAQQLARRLREVLSDGSPAGAGGRRS